VKDLFALCLIRIEGGGVSVVVRVPGSDLFTPRIGIRFWILESETIARMMVYYRW